MSIENGILASISNIFGVLVIWRFMRVFFEPQVEKYKEAASYLAFYIATTSVFWMFHKPIYTLIVNVGGLIFISLLYAGEMKKRIGIAVVIYAVYAACDLIACYLFMDFMASEDPSMLCSFVTVLLFYICEIAAERLIKGKGKQEVSSPMWIIALVPMASILMIVACLAANIRGRVFWLVEGIGILTINILFFFVYCQMVSAFERQIEQEHLSQQAKMYANQLEVMRQSQYQVHGLRHDMKHHLQNIYAMTQQEEPQKVLRYLEQIQDSLENPKEYVTTENVDVDTILNYMLSRAEREGIAVSHKISVSAQMSIETYELNIILCNLLENAIEAAKDSQEKYLSVSILEKKGMLMIHMTNSYSGEYHITSKKGSGHGYGLKNVKNIVEKHQGNVETSCDGKEFQANVMLYL